MKKKILIVNFRDLYGGGEVYLTNLMKELNKSDLFEIYTISPDNKEYIAASKKYCEKIFYGFARHGKFLSVGNFLNYIKEAIKINKIVKDCTIDIIYLNGASGLYLAPFLTLNVKIFAIKHMLIDNPQVWLKKALHIIALKYVQTLIVISNNHKSQLIKLLGDSVSEKISVIYNGIEEGRFVPSDNDISLERKDVIILEIARLTKVKGQELLIESFEILKSKYGNIQLWFAGIGTQLETLQAIVNNKNLSDSIKFLGFIEDTPTLINRSDIIVLPSYNEGLPLSLIEGMAMGKPLISTDIAGIPELIENEINGLLITPGRVDELTLSLSKLIDSKELRIQMGQKGRKLFQEKFTQKMTSKELIKIFLS